MHRNSFDCRPGFLHPAPTTNPTPTSSLLISIIVLFFVWFIVFGCLVRYPKQSWQSQENRLSSYDSLNSFTIHQEYHGSRDTYRGVFGRDNDLAPSLSISYDS